MKLFKKIRKGFTLIELVVVIAVIAILSAVSVVSYVAITNKAKQSSDEQAVRQMNTILQANDVMELKSIRDVLSAFAENGLDAENYKPLFKDRYFFWDQDANRIIYVNKDYQVLYPESMKGQTKGADSHWLSLSGEIAKRDYSSEVTTTSTTYTAAISGSATEAGEKLYKMSEDVASGSLKLDNAAVATTITLPAKVDLAGSEFNLGTAKNLTVSGDATTKTEIQNVLASEYQSKGKAENRKERSYAAGMVQSVEGEVKFENLKISNVSIGEYGVSMTGIFAGQVVKGGHLVIENCEIEDAYIYGEQKVATIVGYVDGNASKVEIKNCTFKNVHIYAEEGVAGGLFGYKTAGSKFECDAGSANSVKANVTCSLTKVSDRSYFTVPSTDLPTDYADGSAEVVSTFEAYSNRVGETKNGKTRCKPSCATFGWIATTDLYPSGATYMVSYGLNPAHAAGLLPSA